MNALLLLPLGVALLNVYALALVLLRAPLFGTRLYRPMLLNIGLSVAPVVVLLATLGALYAVIALAPNPIAVYATLTVGGLVWLLLLPNAGYLVTELNFSHRREDEDVPLWYDIVAVLTLAMSGVLNTLVNVLLAQLVLVLVAYPNDPRPFARATSWVMALVVLLLVSLGVYLGRYVRFNSWDLAHPVAFVRKLVTHLREGRNLRALVGFTVIHTLFFAILYVTVVGPVVATVTDS